MVLFGVIIARCVMKKEESPVNPYLSDEFTDQHNFAAKVFLIHKAVHALLHICM